MDGWVPPVHFIRSLSLSSSRGFKLVTSIVQIMTVFKFTVVKLQGMWAQQVSELEWELKLVGLSCLVSDGLFFFVGRKQVQVRWYWGLVAKYLNIFLLPSCTLATQKSVVHETSATVGHSAGNISYWWCSCWRWNNITNDNNLIIYLSSKYAKHELVRPSPMWTFSAFLWFMSLSTGLSGQTRNLHTSSWVQGNCLYSFLCINFLYPWFQSPGRADLTDWNVKCGPCCFREVNTLTAQFFQKFLHN